MANQEKQSNLSVLFAKLFCSILLVITMLSCVFIPIQAIEGESTFYVENNNLIENLSTELGKEINYYSSLDKTEARKVSSAVTDIINEKRKALIDLQSHKDINTASLEEEIRLAYSKGVVSGKVAWICFSGDEKINSKSSKAEIASVFSSVCSDINNATESAVLNAACDSLCVKMNRCVYSERIKDLALPEDSLNTASIIVGGIDKCKKISSPDILGQAYEKALFDTKQSVHLQRCRDALSAELESIFLITHPAESFFVDPDVALFAYKLGNAATVGEMNKAACEALSSLIKCPEEEFYLSVYVNKLNEAISKAADAATVSGNSAQLSPLFENYGSGTLLARAKDRIYKIIFENADKSDKMLIQIEAQFNKDGAAIDRCINGDEAELEIIRASCRRTLYDKYKKCLSDISTVLGSYDSAEFTARSDFIYENADKTAMSLVTGASFSDACRELVNAVAKDLTAVLYEAKAERFLLDNRSIIQKSKDDLTKTDELPLRTALKNYTRLEPSVCEMLKGQIKNIAEKYNIVITDKIRNLCRDDALYSDLCDNICKELKSVSQENIDVFYNSYDLIFKKATTLGDTVSYYREILSRNLYQSFSKEYKDELLGTVTSTAESIAEENISDKADFTDALTRTAEAAKLAMDRITECARVEITANDSNLMSVQSFLSKAKAEIRACTTKSDMTSVADKYIFKIKRELTKEEMSIACESLKYRMSEMKFLNTSERSNFCAKAEALSSAAVADASIAENLTVLNFIRTNLLNSLDEIAAEAVLEDLERSKTSYTEMLEGDMSKLSRNLSDMVHLSSGTADKLKAETLSLLASFKTNIASCENSTEVAKEYTNYSSLVTSLKLGAVEENLENYKKIISASIDKYLNLQREYSVENYNHIVEEVKFLKQSLSGCKDISECNRQFESAEIRLRSINTLTDDARHSGAKQIADLTDECMAQRSKYSETAILKIQSISDTAKEELWMLNDISEINAYVEKMLANIKAVNKSYAATGEEYSEETLGYPTDHDFSSGYFGNITSENSIPSDAELYMGATANDDLKKVQSAVRSAFKNGKINGVAPTDAELALLKKCNITMGVDISLSSVQNDAAIYSVDMLLPTSVSRDDIIGIVFLCDDGSVEFYNYKIDNSLISFNISHFSNYYIVSESTTNLTPVIVFLIILLFVELLTLAVALLIHYRKIKKENDKNMPPLLYSLIPFNTAVIPSALRVTPKNGVGIVALLSVAALALGCSIALVVKNEFSEKVKKKKSKISVNRSTLPNGEKRAELKEKETVPSLPEHQPEAFICAAAVNSESNTPFELITDCGVPFEYGEVPGQYDEHLFLCREEVNLDVIARKFSPGEVVTLETMRQKHLIGRNTDYVKILARGSLTKPLTIEAHDFSHAAEEMIKAVGGKVIRIE